MQNDPTQYSSSTAIEKQLSQPIREISSRISSGSPGLCQLVHSNRLPFVWSNQNTEPDYSSIIADKHSFCLSLGMQEEACSPI